MEQARGASRGSRDPGSGEKSRALPLSSFIALVIQILGLSLSWLRSEEVTGSEEHATAVLARALAEFLNAAWQTERRCVKELSVVLNINTRPFAPKVATG